jgi:hypothetical protein
VQRVQLQSMSKAIGHSILPAATSSSGADLSRTQSSRKFEAA